MGENDVKITGGLRILRTLSGLVGDVAACFHRTGLNGLFIGIRLAGEAPSLAEFRFSEVG